MADNPTNFWQELKRRRVIRVITVYAAAAFVVLELVDIVAPSLGLPAWTLNFVIVLLCVGFMLSIILSWVYDITPEGVKKTKPIGKNSSGAKQPTSVGWRISTYLSLMLIIAFVVFYIISNIKQSSNISRLERTIAVLPFENFSYGEEYSHYGNSISNEITTELSNIEEFHVVSFTSSSQYQPGNKPPVPQIARELGVNFIIEGSIERQEDKVNIHVQVIQANKDDHIWTHEFDGYWEDIFSIQDDIAFSVAEELKTLLSNEEIEQIEKIPTENLEAYEYYLRGNDFYSFSSAKRDWSFALRNYEKAIELDPDFALAYIKIAISHISMYWYGHDYSMDPIQKCKLAIDTAYKIDPNIPDRYFALGLYYYWGFYDYTEASKQFDVCLQYMPNNGMSIFYKGAIYRAQGELEKASEMMKKALRYDPKNHRIALDLAGTYAYLNEYSEALKYFDLAINLFPGFPASYAFKSEVLLKWEGTTTGARETYDEAALILNLSDYDYMVVNLIYLDIYEGKLSKAINLLNTSKFEVFYNQIYYYPRPLLYAKIYSLMDSDKAEKYYEEARIILEDTILKFPNDPRYYSALGICYAGLGYKDEALEAGHKAVESWPISKDYMRGVYMLRDLALIYTMVGEYELALNQLDYLLSHPSDLSVKLLQLDPCWKSLWELPEFKQLIEKYSDN